MQLTQQHVEHNKDCKQYNTSAVHIQWSSVIQGVIRMNEIIAEEQVHGTDNHTNLLHACTAILCLLMYKQPHAELRLINCDISLLLEVIKLHEAGHELQHIA
eukprot:10087-Heterococcus_DN1.PRE.2